MLKLDEYGHPVLEESTLRDYFAAAALTGLVSQLGTIAMAEQKSKVDGVDIAASAAYDFADAMLKAREKGES